MFSDDLITELAAVSGEHLGILSSMVDSIVNRMEVRSAQHPLPVVYQLISGVYVASIYAYL